MITLGRNPHNSFKQKGMKYILGMWGVEWVSDELITLHSISRSRSAEFMPVSHLRMMMQPNNAECQLAMRSFSSFDLSVSAFISNMNRKNEACLWQVLKYQISNLKGSDTLYGHFICVNPFVCFGLQSDQRNALRVFRCFGSLSFKPIRSTLSHWLRYFRKGNLLYHWVPASMVYQRKF